MRLSRAIKVGAIVLSLILVVVVGALLLLFRYIANDPFTPLYAANCAVCHGEAFDGAAQGPPLVGRELAHGDSVAELVSSIASGYPERGMPGWSGVLDEGEIRSLAILVAERRVNRRFSDFKTDQALTIPVDPIRTELAGFRIETVATGLGAKPFSIAPLPDGGTLVTEKTEGMFIISPDGERSEPVAGTPETTGYGVTMLGLDYGLGWLLDVALHPDYADNGWIYLVHTDLCASCGAEGEDLIPSTMSRLVRGRIRGGRWVDQEVVWSVPQQFYTSVPDLGAGGRLAFDPEGYVFVSVGIKGLGNYVGIQDLSTPYGKIHRVHDDGRIPVDNPFVDRPGAMPSIWSFGHRSPQGLEFSRRTRELWGTEMGPRGGDEVNLLRAGRNFGWPLYSKGVDYDGTPVEYWKELGIEFNFEDIEQPVVDLTPSPAVSSFVIYEGDAFPAWQGNLIVGSLKATELYRFVVDGDRLVHSEILLKDLARVRDVELDRDGEVLLLLEHAAGSMIVRLVPVPA